jgi:hypothetical protein
MSEEYQKVTGQVDVPKNTGVEGFLRTIKEILNLENIQDVHIDAHGKVTYTRYSMGGLDVPVGVDFEGMEPSAIMRYGSIHEVTGGGPPHVLVAAMFDQVAVERLVPICWVVGGSSVFWAWYQSSGVQLSSRDRLYGLPIHFDRGVPDTALILAAAYSRGAATVDCHRFLKLEMEEWSVVPTSPTTTVDILW